jgi:hypothetical protein
VSGRYELYTSSDGVSWARAAQDQRMALGSTTTYVGLIASFGGGDYPKTGTARFDNLSCTGPGCPFGGSTAHGVDSHYAPGPAGMRVTTAHGGMIVINGLRGEALSGLRSVTVHDASGRTISRIDGSVIHGSTSVALATGQTTGKGVCFVRIGMKDGGAAFRKLSVVE